MLPSFSHRCASFAALGLSLLLTAAAAAMQEAASQPATTQPTASQPAGGFGPISEVTLELVQSALQRVETMADLDDAAKAKLTAAYNQALSELRLADEWAGKTAYFQRRIQGAPAELERVLAELDQLPVDRPDDLPADLTLAQLEPLRAKAETEADETRKAADAIEKEMRDRTARRVELPKQLAESDRRLAQISQELTTLAGGKEQSVAAAARRMLLTAEKASIERAQEAMQAELRCYEATEELLNNRNDLEQIRAARAASRAQRMQEAANTRRLREVELIRQKTEAEAHEASSSLHPIVQELAEENVRLATRRTELAASFDSATQKNAEIEAQSATIEKRFRMARDNVLNVGLSNALGLLLRKQQADLPDPAILSRALRALEQEIANSNFEHINLREQRSELIEIDAAVRSTLADAEPPLTQTQLDPVAAAVREKLDARRDLLTALLSDDSKYIELLNKEYVNQKKLLDVTSGFTDFIQEHILWIRSEPVANLADWTLVDDWFRKLYYSGELPRTGERLWQETRENPATLALVVPSFVILYFARRRFRHRIAEIAERIRAPRETGYGPTLAAAGFTLFIAAFWPAVIWFTAWWLLSSTESAALPHAAAAATALARIAQILLSAEIIREICRPGGLGAAHFGWPAGDLARLRRQLGLFMAVAMPTVFVSSVIADVGSDAARSALARALFIVALCMLGAFLHLGLHPRRGSMLYILGISPGGMLYRLRYLNYLLAVGTPGVLVVLAVIGYVYSAARLAMCVQSTLWLMLGLAVLHGMIMRWIVLANRRVAIEQARIRREAARAEAAGTAEAGADGIPTLLLREQIDLPTMNQQTQQLLRFVIGFALLVCIWWIWVPVFPAFQLLRRVHIFTDAVSVADAVLGVLLLVMTLVAGKNVPGLLEIAVLSRLPLDAGERYAITAIARYIITIVGLVAAFGAVGVTWQSVQWLAAAVSLGLGFGLQEIFANFVSGLILLFERPIRVGDTVTVGNVVGTVSRIRSRATTIVDWDRKELVIPNKQFITAEIVNWTLSDSIVRLVIRVGVAYESDTRLVRTLLLKAAKSNPLVLSQPEPSAFFVNFGESTLDFELRVFTQGVEELALTRHQLNSAINDIFHENNIEIAFPQREVRVVSEQPVLPSDGQPHATSTPPAPAPTAASTAK